MNKIEFLAIGDIVVDAFIKLKEAYVLENKEKDEKDICMVFGDKIPYEDAIVVSAVGNSPNAAVSSARLGLKTALITNIGNDRYGEDCLEVLKKENIITDYVKIEENKKTNYHYVLWYGVERTILVKHTEFDFHFPDFKDTEISWIYLSSLAENSLPYHHQIADFLKNHPETKLAFQPGTFQMRFGKEALKEIYERTEIFFCNFEEAERILNIQSKDVKTLFDGLHKLGPKIICISDGPNGAYASDGVNIWYIPMYPDQANPVDRTGAGDAFSSTFTSAIALGKNVEEALSWGPINSMSVVHYVGAQEGLLPRAKLEELLKNAPEEYKAKKIN